MSFLYLHTHLLYQLMDERPTLTSSPKLCAASSTISTMKISLSSHLSTTPSSVFPLRYESNYFAVVTVRFSLKSIVRSSKWIIKWKEYDLDWPISEARTLPVTQGVTFCGQRRGHLGFSPGWNPNRLSSRVVHLACLNLECKHWGFCLSKCWPSEWAPEQTRNLSGSVAYHIGNVPLKASLSLEMNWSLSLRWFDLSICW